MTPSAPRIVDVNAVDPYERGRQRGAALRESLAAGIEIYLTLFATAGITRAQVREWAELSIDAAEAWSPELVAEIRGTADGAEQEVWLIAALNARTEILSQGSGAKPGECSTIVNATAAPVGAQTWDWHEELSGHWHLQQVAGNAHAFVGLTEHGILSKIGMNDAGIGIMLNILGHQDDRVGGVPVHLVSARVLAEAGTIEEAVEILTSAPVSTSSAITVLSPTAAVIVELSPRGAVVLEPVDGVLLHTNHFLDAGLGQGEKPGLYDPDSQLRHGVLVERVAREPLPSVAAQIVPYLLSAPGDLAQLCCVPEAGAVLGDRWATLATVTLDPAARVMTVNAGSPRDTADATTVRLTP
ncbi:C45 family autoproteolytic acyltransferase/hydolase [Glaciibacter psychrotolerans]|uniref:Isopenicillin-N N-acyltransferase-like protein n=1 Tax=Glaciibacter psychrotolerans TaxID=670054 RepID=A0A7Z0EHQ2_9MICO|nr:C45 family peptidase [Leifsonia psychrotolerans]NYJ21137.1 isopenicillin-N N-acyltransferase-like protein [Leifsonia psychrotolerans]